MAGDTPQEMTGENDSGRLVTGKGFERTEHQSIDTNESISSRFSVEKPRMGPPPGTYLVQLPKDQIYRIPTQEDADKYEHLSRQKPNRSNCRRCCCYFLAALLILLVLVALLVGIIFLVFQPHKPRFSVSGVSITGINLTSSSPISPLIKIKVRSHNVNGKLGLIYEKDNAAEIFYEGIKLGNGEFTAFKQPAENVTVIVTELRHSSIQLTSSSRKELTELQKKRNVPLFLEIKAPVKFIVGAVTTWTTTVTVNCKLTVDKLTKSATVMTESCDMGLSLLWISS